MDTINATVDARTLCERAAELIDSGRPGAAKPLLAAAKQLGSHDDDVTMMVAQVAVIEGDWVKAVTELDAAVSAQPGHGGLRRARAELRHRMGDCDGAARDAAEAVISDPDDHRAKAQLGAALLDLGLLDDAIACLREAVVAQPGVVAYAEILAAAQERTGDTDAALKTLNEAITRIPAALSPRNAAIMLCIRRRDFNCAVRLAEQARADGIADATTFGMKGHALCSLGRHPEATLAYGEALKLNPEDAHVRHLLAASEIPADAERADEPFLRRVFDGYAYRFESHLLALRYGIPEAIRKALEKHPKIAAGKSLGPVLDLGCGTGLAAMAIGDLDLGPLTGIDVSPRMLDQARLKRLYAELRQGDLMDELARTRQRWPLIVAADVVCYFGALNGLLAAVHRCLEPSGWFIFSVEEILADHDGVMPGNGNWALGRQGRYSHSPEYVHEAAFQAGFRILRIDRPSIRQEAGSDVPGLLLTLERMGAA